MQRLLLLFLLFLSHALFSQTTRGKIYAADKTLEGALVQNITQNKTVLSDEKGDFAIAAAVNDSIIVSAAFHEKQIFIIEPYQLDQVWVVDLKEINNELDEVKLSSAKKEKEFKIEEYDANFSNAIQNDIKENPYLYYPKPSGGMDLIKVAGLIAGLFKSKNNKEDTTTITYFQLQSLFESDNLFTKELLTNQLQILPEYHELFLDFCSAQNLKSDLLLEENHFQLLDRIIDLNSQFQKIISDYKSSKKEN